MSAAASPSSTPRPGTLQSSHQASMLPIPASADPSVTPDAVTLKFPSPVPWRVTGNDGSTSYQWSHLGRTAQHWAQEWARNRQGIATFGYLTGVSREQLDLTDDRNALPIAVVKITDL